MNREEREERGGRWREGLGCYCSFRLVVLFWLVESLPFSSLRSWREETVKRHRQRQSDRLLKLDKVKVKTSSLQCIRSWKWESLSPNWESEREKLWFDLDFEEENWIRLPLERHFLSVSLLSCEESGEMTEKGELLCLSACLSSPFCVLERNWLRKVVVEQLDWTIKSLSSPFYQRTIEGEGRDRQRDVCVCVLRQNTHFLLITRLWCWWFQVAIIIWLLTLSIFSLFPFIHRFIGMMMRVERERQACQVHVLERETEHDISCWSLFSHFVGKMENQW